MNNTVLTQTEFEEIIHFSQRIVRPVKDIRQTILYELSRIFGYSETIFWHVDDNGDITDPEIYLLNNRVLYDYLNYYQNDEIFHLKHNLHLFYEKRVMRMIDLMTIDQYEKSPYFQYFMKPHGFFDVMSIALSHENRLIGIIGMARKKDQYNFTKVDCKRLEYLSTIIASVLAHQFEGDVDYSTLTNREKDVVKLLKEGRTNQSIAEELQISINTVKKHLQRIYQIHSVQNRTQLIHKLKYRKA